MRRPRAARRVSADRARWPGEILTRRPSIRKPGLTDLSSRGGKGLHLRNGLRGFDMFRSLILARTCVRVQVMCVARPGDIEQRGAGVEVPPAPGPSPW